MRARAHARLALIRATEQALDKYPDRTLALVRATLERSARQRTENRFESRVLMVALTIRAMDVHPVVAERLVRLWLRRAAQRHLASSTAIAGGTPPAGGAVRRQSRAR